MMSNLFSIFDPISSIMFMSLNWLSLMFGLMFIPMSFWLIPNRIYMFNNMMFKLLHNEMKVLMSNSYFLGSTMIFISLFWMIMFNNSLGLFPYIFISTSHMMITFSLSFPLWMSFMMYGWFNKSMMMFSHLVPESTPMMLMSFMVCIETISNMIRSGTLAIRLAANMIAGHLLLSLLGNQGLMVDFLILILLLLSQIFLLILESAVALIQSYVFMILSSLYSSEVY
uniref:ATP synthase subunit a n=1 Tax=Peripatoides sp. DVL-2010 TaxID=867919 RepID=F8RJ90_9BILA|nr:ATP synthase F0 subunit 6 [Peripatoides sp. DVL-2010]